MASGAALPIDAHSDRIVAHVREHRVTVIHGETGCGKSSRVPLILLAAQPDAKMFVSQPRRIAARALCDRVRDTHDRPEDVALRLGHGVRDEGAPAASSRFFRRVAPELRARGNELARAAASGGRGAVVGRSRRRRQEIAAPSSGGRGTAAAAARTRPGRRTAPFFSGRAGLGDAPVAPELPRALRPPGRVLGLSQRRRGCDAKGDRGAAAAADRRAAVASGRGARYGRGLSGSDGRCGRDRSRRRTNRRRGRADHLRDVRLPRAPRGAPPRVA